MNKLAPLPTSPSEFIFDFKSTPNFAFQTCAHFSTPFKTYFWGNLPPAIENEWCKLDQKLKEKEAKQEAREKKWNIQTCTGNHQQLLCNRESVLSTKISNQFRPLSTQAWLKQVLGLSTVQKHNRPRYQTWLKFPPECIPIKEYTAKSANAMLFSVTTQILKKKKRIKSAEYGNKLIQWVTGVKYLESVLVLRLVKQEAAPNQFTWGRFVNTCH